MATLSPRDVRPDPEAAALKVPPHSIEAEQSVLGGLMLDNAAWDQVADLVGEADFYRYAHRLIFRAIGALAEQNNPFDVVTLSSWLRDRGELEPAGGLAYLGELAANTPSAANIKAYATLVRERSVLRDLIRVAGEVADSAFQPDGRDTSALLDHAERLVFEIAERGLRRRAGFRVVKDLLVTVVDRIDALYQRDNPITGVSTGFSDLDGLTSGLQASDLVIVAGRPSMGKTSFAMNLAEHALLGDKLPVAVFSMEMPAEQLVMRLLSSLGRIDQHKVRTGKLDPDDWPRLTSAIGMLSERPMFIDDTPALTPTELRARARRLKREHGLGLVVIDYLQLMQVPGTRENRATEISEISRSLKALAKELAVPIVALSQLNRSLEQRPNKRPVMSDLRECVTGDTLVCLSDGRRVPVRDLVGQTPRVWSLDADQRVVEADSDKVWSVGVRPVFRVTLASGRALRATAAHRLLGAEGWRTVSELGPGDRLAMARRIPEPGPSDLDWSEEQIVLLGHLVGDGSYLKHQPLRYTTASEENSRAVRAAAEALGSTVSRQAGRGQWHQLVIAGNGNRWHAAGVGAWLKSLGIYGQRSHEKRLPVSVFGLGNEKVALLLRHLWATDGSISVRSQGSKGAARVFFSTASDGLASDVAALLLRFGIVARIRGVAQRSHRPVYTVDVTGSDQQRSFLDEVGAFGPRVVPASRLRSVVLEMQSNPNVDTLPKEVFAEVRAAMNARGVTQRGMAALRGTAYGGSSHFRFAPSRRTLASYADLLESDSLRRWAQSDLYWDRVVAVEPDGEEEVFDLTVPGPACWLADGVVSHNSGAIEQDADLIMFIYRDEVYNEESPDKGTAEIIVAKQRNGPIGMVRLTFLGKYTRFENHSPETAGAGAYL